MKRKLLYALPAIAWMILILMLTLQPGEASSDLSGGVVSYLYNYVQALNLPLSINQFHFLIRKTAHLTEYVILGLLLYVALLPYNLMNKHKFVIIFLWGLSFASLDEFIQTFVEGRVGAVTDVLIDSVGVMLSLALVSIVQRFRRESKV